MKLLDKKVINEAVSAERKTVIDSGIVLAKKVDKLREELLNLEKERSDFIAGSQEELEKAIGDLKREKSNLGVEVKEATRQLAKLREPLDKEWKNLEMQRKGLEALQSQCEKYFEGLIIERNLLLKERELVDAEHNTAWNNQYETEKLLQKATSDRKETTRVLAELQSLRDVKEAELYLRETALNDKEKSLAEREEKLQKDRSELNKEKKLLAIKKQRIR